jgi:hypothetical protein
MSRIPYRSVCYKVFSTLRESGTLSSAHVSSERARQQHADEQENILDMVQRSPTTNTRRLSTRLGVSRTSDWWALHDDCLYPFHPQRVQNIHPEKSAMRLEFCHWLQLLPVILLTDEATFTRNGINNTRNSHRWSHNNPHGAVETNFQNRFAINVWCGMIDVMLTGPVILDDGMTFCKTDYQNN